MAPPAPAVVYLMVVEHSDDDPCNGERVEMEKTFENLADANAAVREYCAQWDPESMEVCEEKTHPDGSISVHIEFPEGEQDDVFIRTLHVQPSKRNNNQSAN